MKQFFKFIFASCLGTMLALGGIIFIFFLIGSAGSTPLRISDESVLHLKLNHNIPELTDNVSPGQFGISEGLSIGLNDISRLIKEATNDKQIEGIYLQTESSHMNPTSALAIAREIELFKASGKFVYAYGDYFTQSGYIIASVADSVYLNPNGLVDLRGYGIIIPYFEDFSSKTGVNFDVYHAGKYKSAVEPYYRSESSQENRYQTESYLGHYQNALITHISHNRNIDKSDIDKIVTQGLSNNSDDAIEYKLVDQLQYPEDILGKINKKANKENLVTLEEYFQAKPKSKSNHKNKIAVIYAEGDVAFGGDQRGGISMDRYDEIFDRLEKNDKVKAIVLRVNSPGGSSFTSDRFLKRVKDLQDKGKFIVASFGDYAASGGYYIAVGADKIVSEPTTLTGSIGVFSMMADFSEMSREHLGINWDTIGTGKRTFLFSSFTSRSKEDHALLTAETERIYRQFKGIVAEGRNIPIEEVDKIAQGRVWSGIDAVEAGLVDTLGGLNEAIALAARAVEFDEYKLLEYPIIKKDFWEVMLENLAANSQVSIPSNHSVAQSALSQFGKTLEIIDAACKTPQARLPFLIEVH